MAVGEGCCRMAHWTVRCASHITQLLGFDRWSLWHVGQRTVRWCTGQVLFTVRWAIWRLLWLLRAQLHCSLFTVDFCRRPLAQLAVAPLAHQTFRCYTGQSGATPDSPVNYSGVAPRIPEGGKFGVDLPGAPDTVRWCIGQCPVRQTRAAFGCLLLFLFEHFLGFFIGLCWTFGTCRTYNLEQTS
jgi:hypothetical protein